MSGSETGVMTSREPFGVGLQNNNSPLQSQSQSQSQSSQSAIHNMRLNFPPADAASNALYNPAAAASPTYQTAAAVGSVPAAVEGSVEGAVLSPPVLNMNMGSEPLKRKRGRPRKYGPDGTMALGLSPSAPPSVTVAQNNEGFSPPPPPSGGNASPTSSKKGRGRPPGSKKQQSAALGSAGFGFTPHVITVKAGEDISSKIMSLTQSGPRAVCIMSAIGAISSVTLRQPSTGGTVTYEGRFEILSLSGSFLLSENAGPQSGTGVLTGTGALSVSLSSPDGRVLGGCVAGVLTAASPVQVIVGSFIADGQKPSKTANQMSAGPRLATGSGATGASSPPSRGTLSESSGGPGSPLNQGIACNNSNPQGMSSMPWK